MAQIIKHRRGSLEKLSEVTGSLQKGEIVLATGSANLTTTNGTALSFIVPESGSVQATNRFLMGSSNPNIFSASTYNGMLKGVPYYASGSSTLFLLGSDGNEAINLVGNIQPFSGSVNTRLSDVEAAIGGAGSGISTRVSNLEALTGSYATTGSNQFNGDQTITGSLLVTGPIQGTGSIYLQPNVGDARQLEIYNTGASDVHIKGTTGLTFLGDDTNYVAINDSAGTVTITAVNGINFTGSLTASGDISSSTLNGIGNVTLFSQSVDTRFSASAANVTSLSASVASVTGDFSSSVATSFSASAASVAALSASVDTRLDTVEFSGSTFATTGSNIFFGTQVITGSVFISQNLVVQGSSSVQNITASAVSIGTNTIILNTATPAVRYAGISVFDSGSTNVTASLFYDGLTNNWKFEHNDTGTNDASIVLFGPLGSGIDNAPTLSANFLTKVEDNGHGHHLTTSSVSDTGTKVTINNPLDVNGDTIVTGSITVKDVASEFKIEGNGFGETYLQTTTGNLLLHATNGGNPATVNVKGGNLTVDGTISGSIVGIGNVTIYSQSVDSRLGTIETSLGGGGSLGTRVSNLETISGSYLAFTQSYYTDSASFDTRISASVAGYTANSASAATSFSASLASQTALSASIATTNNTQTDNISTVSASAWGAFQSASSYSGSIATSISASKAEYTSFSASTASDFNTLSGSAYTQFSASAATATANSASAATSFSASIFTATANSASAATDFNTLSGSAFTQFSASAASVTANSASAATSFSASNAQIAAVSASVASTTGEFSGSIYTQFSASAATATANSASAASDFNTLSGSAFTQFSASAATVTANSASAATSFSASAATATANSASAATSFSASLASQTALSASIATTDNAQTERLGALETYSSSLKTAIELTGSNVTIQGDLLVRGTTTSVNSTTIELGDNIIQLNGSGASNGGLYVKDVTSPNLATGSLIWDSTNDYWKAGVKDSEYKVLLATGDNVFTSSIQTALSGTFGYSDFSSSIATSFSASNASIASVTGDFSSSVATSFSASAFTVTANSASAATDFNTLSGSTYTQFSASAASVTANSASAATSFSASLASQTALSSSVDSRLDTLEGSGSIQGVGTANNVSFSSVTASLNVPGGASTKRLAFRGLTDNIEFIAAPTTAGDIAQWNGTDFVMSNTIDGGSF
jgi:hypothetical protein